jgi:3-hydroxybutyrate dehydrogenase
MLKGKVAIVTGSTSGIGLGVANALASQGSDIVLNGFGDAVEIECLRKSLASEYGVRVGYSAADMSKSDEIVGMVSYAVGEFGRVDILVNNAGIQFTAPVHEFPIDRWDARRRRRLPTSRKSTACSESPKWWPLKPRRLA